MMGWIKAEYGDIKYARLSSFLIGCTVFFAWYAKFATLLSPALI
jgi:hypothetical protein